jgi:hypothetical protein
MLFCALVLTSRPHADLALFSLERIKTATALGGGVAVLRNSQVSNKMKRLHQSLYDSQTQAEFLWKVIKAAFIRIVGTSPNLYAVIALSCRWLGFNFDRVVSTSTRTFSSEIAIYANRKNSTPPIPRTVENARSKDSQLQAHRIVSTNQDRTM